MTTVFTFRIESHGSAQYSHRFIRASNITTEFNGGRSIQSTHYDEIDLCSNRFGRLFSTIKVEDHQQ